MNIFNSLGSNYKISEVTNSLFDMEIDTSERLKDILKDKYNGDVFLFYKGRHAIEAGLKMLNLPVGSQVAINGFTCFVVYKAIVNAGLDVVYLDIPKNGINFTPKELLEKLRTNPKIKAVIIQNTLGCPSDIEAISKICRNKKIVLVEDLAHSDGGKYGDLIALSFSQDKIIDSVSGGALIVKNRSLIDNNITIKSFNVPKTQVLKDRLYPIAVFSIRTLYSFGLGKVIHKVLKHLHLLSDPLGNLQNAIYKLPNWHASLAGCYIKTLSKDILHRRKISKVYTTTLPSEILVDEYINKLDKSANIRFPIKVQNREDLIKFMKSKGIYISDTWYDAPVAPKKYLSLTNYKKGQCPNSEKLSLEIINLPTHKNVSEEDACKIANYIKIWINTK